MILKVMYDKLHTNSNNYIYFENTYLFIITGSKLFKYL